MELDLRIAAEAADTLARRREGDGLLQLALFKHQAAFIASDKPEAWLFGANRTGKTEGLSYCLSAFARFGLTDPRPAYVGGGAFIFDRAVRVWAISLTFDMSRNILQPKMFDNGMGINRGAFLIPTSEIAGWNITTQTLRLKNGSIVLYKSCEGGRDTFQGADLDIAGFDEVPPQEVYRETTMRVGGGRRLLIRGAATILPPAGTPGGVSWMYTEKVRPWLASGRNKKNKHLDIFTAGIRDNPTIDPAEIARMEATMPPGTPEHRIRIMGELLPSIGGSLCYPEFLADYHCNAALAPVADGVPRPQIIPYLPLALCCDFNTENGVWTVGQKVGRIFRVVDEITMERSDVPNMSYEFRARYPHHAAELWIYGDTTGRKAENQTGESNYHLIASYLAGYPAPIRYILPSVNPPVKDRVAAVNLILRPPTGERRFEIAPHCTETIRDLEASKWTTNGKIDKRNGRRSDGADTVGYWISTVEPTSGYAGSRQIKSVRSPVYSPSSSSSRAFPAAFRGYTGRPGRFIGRQSHGEQFARAR
jgi:hypothetical protein